MKTNGLGSILLIAIFIISCYSVPVFAQDTNKTYANTPKVLSPYSRFQNPYKNFFDEPQPYLGAAREKEVPSDIKTVKIGFIGPLEGAEGYSTIYGKQMLHGAQIALEEANKKGGYKGVPFELLARNDIGLWGASGNELVALDDQKVIGVIGSIDGNNSHIAIRVALKLEIPVVNTGSTDPTLTETRIPWVIRCNADDRQFNYALVNEVINKKGYTKIAVLRSNNRYARVGTKEFIDGTRRMGYPVRLHLRYFPGETNFDDQLEKIQQADIEAVLLWGEADEAARIVKRMRELNMNQAIFGCDRLISGDFAKLAGKDAEGVIAVYPYNPNSGDPDLNRFNTNYKAKFGEEPDWFAVHAYDGMNIMIDAIQQVGLNRAKVRDVLTSIKHYKGISGDIILDATWNDVGPVWLAEVKQGQFKFREFKPVTE